MDISRSLNHSSRSISGDIWDWDSDSSSDSGIDNMDINIDLNIEEIEEIEEVVVDLSIAIVSPLFKIPHDYHIEECSICLEAINMVNVSITTCGHTFHSYCMFKSIEKNNCCPLCRNTLIEKKKQSYDDSFYDDEDGEDEDDEDGEDEDGEDGEEDDEDDDDEEDDIISTEVSTDQLCNKLINMGYSLKDVMRYFMGQLITNKEQFKIQEAEDKQKYTQDYFRKLDTDINSIIDGTKPLYEVDTRTYAQVVNNH